MKLISVAVGLKRISVYRFELLPFVIQIILVDFFEMSPMGCLYGRK